ncbi:MAG: arginine--tRNA ligase [Saprospiraceae bacterium]
MIKEDLQHHIAHVLRSAFDFNINPDEILIVPTKKEFEGDFTLTVFPLAGKLKKAPAIFAEEIGTILKNNGTIKSFQVVKGFLNIAINDVDWVTLLNKISNNSEFGKGPTKNEVVLVEFCSPNTNKPLHLGHVRNMLLGDATARILEYSGFEVKRIQVINDRGIAICKSMLSWQKWGNGDTPGSTGIKGDHFVGNYYVRFEAEFSKEYIQWQDSSRGIEVFDARKEKELSKADFFKEYKNQYFNLFSLLGKEAREMLLKWEKNDPSTIALWKEMNHWVYEGFAATNSKLNISFDHTDYESVTYLLGKKVVQQGIEKGIFYKKEDESVWIDLSDVGMDQKLVLRSDGTSVYITQDLGTALMRYEQFKMNKLIYVVADEQDYHFRALFEIIKKFDQPYSNGLFHLSYGMVELPEGKMKSREGTVVDADDLIDEIISEATTTSASRGELEMLNKVQQKDIVNKVALGAIKFFMLRVHPKRRMVFNPKDSLDLQGQTGPYVQNAFVRIQSVLRKAEKAEINVEEVYSSINAEEKDLLILMESYPEVIRKAADQYDPSEIANYSYTLAKAFHKFYHEVPILRAENEGALNFRLKLARSVGNVLQRSFELIGIEMPEKM